MARKTIRKFKQSKQNLKMKKAELKLVKKLHELNRLNDYNENLLKVDSRLITEKDFYQIRYLCLQSNFDSTMLELLTIDELYYLFNDIGYSEKVFNNFVALKNKKVDILESFRYKLDGSMIKKLIANNLFDKKYFNDANNYLSRLETLQILRKNNAYEYIKAIKDKNLSKFIISESFKSSDSKFNEIVTKYIKYANFDKCNYFTIRESKISYHPKPEKQVIVSGLGTWKKDGRQLTTFSKVLKMVFGKYYEPILKLETRKGLNIENESLKLQITPLKAIKTTFEKAYNLNMSGWSQSSCMNNKGYFELYNQNLDVFTPYIFKENNETVGRAYTVKSDNGIFLDRIYFKNEKHLKSIQKLAIKKGWFYKKQNTYNCETFTNGILTKTPNDISIICDCEEFPFIDTFCYMNYNENKLSVNSDGMAYKLQNTDGSKQDIEENHDGEIQLENGGWVCEEDAVYIEIGSCRGEYHHIDDCVNIESGQRTGWAHVDDCTYNENLGEYILDN